jgi:hypothetical protein
LSIPCSALGSLHKASLLSISTDSYRISHILIYCNIAKTLVSWFQNPSQLSDQGSLAVLQSISTWISYTRRLQPIDV